MNATILVVEHEAMADSALIGARIAATGFDFVVVGPDRGSSVPPSANGFAGVVVLGGSMGPLDDESAPWLPEARSLIRDCAARSVPLLAVCLGAQLAAVALGGRVGPAPTPEVGLSTVTLKAAASDDALFADLDQRTPTLQWHWLEIIEPPPGAVVLASSDLCGIQAFRLGECAWATQFHLEAVADTARTWAGEMAHDIRSIGLEPEQVIRVWEDAARDVEGLWADVIDRWLTLVREECSRD